MRVAGRPQPQKTHHKQLARRRGQQVPPAHDLGHAHAAVIHGNSKLVGHHPVRAPQGKIPAKFPGAEAAWSHDRIGEGNALVGAAQPQGRMVPGGQPPPLLGGAESAAGVRPFRAFLARMGGRGQQPQLPAAAKAGIGVSRRLQPRKGFGIDGGALALVPVKAEPCQIFQNGGGECRA